MRSSICLAMGLLLLLGSCGDSDTGSARTVAEVCDEVCGWPDECFVQLGVSAPGAECMQSCEAQVDLVGLDCLRTISDTVACLGTCDFESLTEEQILDCQDVALRIESACE